jgi:hypothetical protein
MNFLGHFFATYPRSFAYTTAPHMRGKEYEAPSEPYAVATAPDTLIVASTPSGFLDHYP